MAEIKKYVTETVNIGDDSYNYLKVYQYILETVNITDIRTDQDSDGVDDDIVLTETDVYIFYCDSECVPTFPAQYCGTSLSSKGCTYLPTLNVDSITIPEPPKPVIISNAFLNKVLNCYFNEASLVCNSNYIVEYKNTLTTSSIMFGFLLNYITETKVIEVTLYSTFDVPLTITGFTYPHDLGITTEGLEVGDVIPPHGAKTFKFIIDIKGKTYVNGDLFTIHTDNNIMPYFSYCFMFIRKQDFILAIYPNKNSYYERYYFSTKKFVSLSGVEDRKAMIDIPKQRFSGKYSALPTLLYRKTENLLLRASELEIFFPIWSEQVKSEFEQGNVNAIIVPRVSEFIKKGTYIAVFDVEGEAVSFKVVDVNLNDNTIIIGSPWEIHEGTVIVPIVKVVNEGDFVMNYFNEKDRDVSANFKTLR